MKDSASLAWARDERPISTHTAGIGGLFRCSWPILMLAGFTLALSAVGFFVPAKEGPTVALIVGLVCLAGTLALLGWGIARFLLCVREVELYPSGIIWKADGRRKGAQWEEISEVYRTEVKLNGSTQTKQVYLKTHDGKEATLTHALGDWGHMADLIMDETTKRLWPMALRAYNAGQAVHFGENGITRRGLIMHGKLVKWEEMKGLKIANGMLQVIRPDGELRDTDFLTFGQMPNYIVFLKLLQESPAPLPNVLK